MHVDEWLPQARQLTIEGCGHVPQAERAQECSELLMRFFASVEGGELRPPVAHAQAA